MMKEALIKTVRMDATVVSAVRKVDIDRVYSTHLFYLRVKTKHVESYREAEVSAENAYQTFVAHLRKSVKQIAYIAYKVRESTGVSIVRSFKTERGSYKKYNEMTVKELWQVLVDYEDLMNEIEDDTE